MKFESFWKKYSALKWAIVYLVVILLFAVCYLLLPDSHWGSDERISNFGDAFYFSVATITSLGFGDIYPAAGTLGRLLVAVEAVSGILIIGLFLNDVAMRQAARVDKQNRVAEEKKKRNKALDDIKTFRQILTPVFDRYLRGVYMMVSTMDEKFKIPQDIFKYDFNFQYKDMSHLYEETILMSSDFKVSSVEAHFKNQDIAVEELKFFVTHADLNYWPEIRELIYDFVSLHHCFQYKDIVLNNRLRKLSDGKPLSEFVTEQIAKKEDASKFKSGNMFSPYVALYQCTKGNVVIIKQIYEKMQWIMDNAE